MGLNYTPVMPVHIADRFASTSYIFFIVVFLLKGLKKSESRTRISSKYNSAWQRDFWATKLSEHLLTYSKMHDVQKIYQRHTFNTLVFSHHLSRDEQIDLFFCHLQRPIEPTITSRRLIYIFLIKSCFINCVTLIDYIPSSFCHFKKEKKRKHRALLY